MMKIKVVNTFDFVAMKCLITHNTSYCPFLHTTEYVTLNTVLVGNAVLGTYPMGEHGWLNLQIDPLHTLSYSTKFGGSTSQWGEYA